MIPSIPELAKLVALIAREGEDFRVAAKRALELWNACDQEIYWAKEKHDREMKEGNDQFEHYQAESQFLHLLLLGKKPKKGEFEGRLDYPAFPKGTKISLDVLLSTLMPQKKVAAKEQKWRAFRAENLTTSALLRGLAKSSEQEILDGVADAMERDRKNGFTDFNSLLFIRTEFLEFLARDTVQQLSERAEKGVLGRKNKQAKEGVEAGEGAPAKKRAPAKKGASAKKY